MNARLALAALTLACCGAAASADTVSARYSYSFLKNVDISSAYRNGSTPTVTFNWTRCDTPGPGVDNTIAHTFKTYCVDLAQTVSSGVTNDFNVVSGEQHGFSANQINLLTSLWGTYQSQVNTALESAAFQVAIWELVYDSNKNVSTGSFHLNNCGDVAALAQQWIDTISGSNFCYSGPCLTMRVLESDCLQDQVTFVPCIPTPGAAAMLGMGGLMIARRRR